MLSKSCLSNVVTLVIGIHCNSGFGAFNSKPSRCITFIPILFANIPTYMPSCLKKDDEWKKPQQTKLPHRKNKCFQHETHAKIWIKHPWKFSLPNLLPFLPLLKPQGFLLKLPSHKISFGEISLHREERTASMLTKTSSASVFKRKENLPTLSPIRSPSVSFWSDSRNGRVVSSHKVSINFIFPQ